MRQVYNYQKFAWANYGLSTEQSEELEANGEKWKIECAKGNARMACRLTDETLIVCGPKGYTTTVLATPLAETGICQRTRTLLEADPFRAMTIGAVLNIDPIELRSSVMVGPATYDEIIARLLKYALDRCLAQENGFRQKADFAKI